MKAIPDKCHLITSSGGEVSMYVENYNIKSSKCEKLLGIKIDNRLNFNNQLWNMQKSRTKVKCTAKGYPLHGLTEALYVAEYVFIWIQLLPFSLDVS